MQLFSLLSVSQETTTLVAYLSYGAVVLLLGAIALISLKGKRHYDAKRISFASICLALSFALSYAKVSPVLYGGSITLASFVPILIYAYAYGFVDGLLVGLIFGLLNFLSSPYIHTGATFLLDYLLAFASIAVMGFARKFTKNQTANVILGTLAVYSLRFVFHLISGFIYFADGAIWVELPAWAVSNAFIYSFVYQSVYIPADCTICVVALFLLAKSKALDRLLKMLLPKEKTAVKTEE